MTNERGAGAENGWHVPLRRNGYEWWYVDVISDDREWSLVVIFLLGNPFSSYYRKCTLDISPDPLDHNGVFVSLHHRSHLRYYNFVSYPQRQIKSGEVKPLDLHFGPNRIVFDTTGNLKISVAEENANRRRVALSLLINCGRALRHTAVPAVELSSSHSWLPALPSARAKVDCSISLPGVTSDTERIAFNGSGYHDHNWGILPFDGTVESWIWARLDFGKGLSVVVYWILSTGGQSRCKLLLYQNNEQVYRTDNAQPAVSTWRRSSLTGMKLPVRFTVQSVGVSIEVVAERVLENVPFYGRFVVTATMMRNGINTAGIGMTERFIPGGMGAPLVAAAMERRIYHPADGA